MEQIQSQMIAFLMILCMKFNLKNYYLDYAFFMLLSNKEGSMDLLGGILVMNLTKVI